jgi:hypothetical protein
MNRFTVNPAFPHPDQDSDNVPLPTLQEAVDFARKVLHNERADMFTRRRAAFDLLLALENHEDEQS